MDLQKNIVEKCVKVIDSCVTHMQLKSAVRYVELAFKYLNNTKLYSELIKLTKLKEKLLYYAKFKENNKG